MTEQTNLQLKSWQAKAARQQTDLIRWKVSEQRKKFVPSFVIVCMGLVLYVHHSICLTYHLSSEALPVCFRINHLLSTKTGHVMRFSVSS